MRECLIRLILAVAISISSSAGLFGQTPRRPQKRQTTEPAQPATRPAPSEAQQEIETVKIDTNLVTIPVIATDRQGLYVPDVLRQEVSIYEDGVQQTIAFFKTVNTPFHVVLMLDTSASTEEKLRQIQNAAVAFVEQLQPADRVEIISFDDQVRELNIFTNDREALKSAILKTHSGQSTKLYDAFGVALDTLRKIPGRRAIVLFTDGVDQYSDRATYDGTLYGLDEEGVIVYPIRYDTRAETERIVREAQEGSTQLPTIGVIHTNPAGTTAPTFPSDDPDTVPTRGTRTGGGILGLPSPNDILRGRRSRDPRTDPTQPGTPDPPARRPPDPSTLPGSKTGSDPRLDESTRHMLDQLYLTADSYLKALADKSGGRLVRADTLGSLPEAFAKIAAELRTQYSIGYYPTNAAHDGLYRQVKVTTTRKNVVVRAKPGYRAPTN